MTLSQSLHARDSKVGFSNTEFGKISPARQENLP
jgi:hypothetical protein